MKPRLNVLTRWKATRMTIGYGSLAISFGISLWNFLIGFAFYCLGLVFVGMHATGSFRRGMRVGCEIEQQVRGAFSLDDVPDEVKDAVAQDMARRVELALQQRIAAREGRN